MGIFVFVVCFYSHQKVQNMRDISLDKSDRFLYIKILTIYIQGLWENA